MDITCDDNGATLHLKRNFYLLSSFFCREYFAQATRTKSNKSDWFRVQLLWASTGLYLYTGDTQYVNIIDFFSLLLSCFLLSFDNNSRLKTHSSKLIHDDKCKAVIQPSMTLFVLFLVTTDGRVSEPFVIRLFINLWLTFLVGLKKKLFESLPYHSNSIVSRLARHYNLPVE